MHAQVTTAKVHTLTHTTPNVPYEFLSTHNTYLVYIHSNVTLRQRHLANTACLAHSGRIVHLQLPTCKGNIIGRDYTPDTKSSVTM